MITSSGSRPSRSRSTRRSVARRSDCSHQSSPSPSVQPATVIAPVSSNPARRRCSITSGTPPARNTCTVGNIRGPLGSASTRRGTCALIRAQSSTVGRRKPAENAIAGKCRIKFVDPPKAACVTIALCRLAAVSTSRMTRPRASS